MSHEYRRFERSYVCFCFVTHVDSMCVYDRMCVVAGRARPLQFRSRLGAIWFAPSSYDVHNCISTHMSVYVDVRADLCDSVTVVRECYILLCTHYALPFERLYAHVANKPKSPSFMASPTQWICNIYMRRGNLSNKFYAEIPRFICPQWFLCVAFAVLCVCVPQHVVCVFS